MKYSESYVETRGTCDCDAVLLIPNVTWLSRWGQGLSERSANAAMGLSLVDRRPQVKALCDLTSRPPPQIAGIDRPHENPTNCPRHCLVSARGYGDFYALAH